MAPVWVGSIAQRLEQGTHNPLVEGSNPSGPNLFYRWSNRQTCDLTLSVSKPFTGCGQGA